VIQEIHLRFLLLQVFVANPNKPKPILEILLRNREKLVEFLTKFHSERTDDDQFNDEKAYLIKQIKDLKLPSETASSTSAAH
jgi:calcium binding protein 39